MKYRFNLVLILAISFLLTTSLSACGDKAETTETEYMDSLLENVTGDNYIQDDGESGNLESMDSEINSISSDSESGSDDGGLESEGSESGDYENGTLIDNTDTIESTPEPTPEISGSDPNYSSFNATPTHISEWAEDSPDYHPILNSETGELEDVRETRDIDEVLEVPSWLNESPIIMGNAQPEGYIFTPEGFTLFESDMVSIVYIDTKTLYSHHSSINFKITNKLSRELNITANKLGYLNGIGFDIDFSVSIPANSVNLSTLEFLTGYDDISLAENIFTVKANTGCICSVDLSSTMIIPSTSISNLKAVSYMMQYHYIIVAQQIVVEY